MALEPWYKVAMPRPGVREGRSFNSDECALRSTKEKGLKGFHEGRIFTRDEVPGFLEQIVRGENAAELLSGR